MGGGGAGVGEGGRTSSDSVGQFLGVWLGPG